MTAVSAVSSLQCIVSYLSHINVLVGGSINNKQCKYFDIQPIIVLMGLIVYLALFCAAAILSACSTVSGSGSPRVSGKWKYNKPQSIDTEPYIIDGRGSHSRFCVKAKST